MGFRRQENYRTPEFCAECPATAEMDQIEVRLTNNFGPEVNSVYSGDMPPERQIYAHDPKNPDAGAVVLGEDFLVDPMCSCCEFAASRTLGKTHEKIESCEGPQLITSWFGLKKSIVCGAGFRDGRKFIEALNKRGKYYPNIQTILPAQSIEVTKEIN